MRLQRIKRNAVHRASDLREEARLSLGRRKLRRTVGGLRKVRFAPSGRGKRGGIRVIYYWRTQAGEIYYFDIFAKNEKDNLSAKELADLQ